MIALRRRTRETLRHERAVVRQVLGTPSVAAVQADWAANKARAAELRRATGKGGGHRAPLLGLVTNEPVAGGNGPSELPCKYCGVIGGHNGNCPVIS